MSLRVSFSGLFDPFILTQREHYQRRFTTFLLQTDHLMPVLYPLLLQNYYNQRLLIHT